MKTLIVYYTLEGNTEYAARAVASAFGADMLRLEPVKAYPASGFRKFFWGGKSAVMAEKPALQPYAFQPEMYDRIIFGFPVWAGNVTPPLHTFIQENLQAFKGKRIAAFACQSGAGAEKALKKLRTYLGIDQMEAEMVLIDPRTRPSPENEKQITAFCGRLLRMEKGE